MSKIGVGIKLHVLRDVAAAHINGNISDRKTEIVLLDKRVEGIFAPNDESPGFRIFAMCPGETRLLRADDPCSQKYLEDATYCLIADGAIAPREWEHGGNFAYIDNHQFQRLYAYPLPIFDRKVNKHA